MAENYGSLEGVLDANETLEGEIDSHDEMSGEIQFSGGVGGVKDVQVNNESVVDANKVAHIDLTPYAEKEDVYDKDAVDTLLEGKADVDDIPTNLSDLQDDADHRLVTDTEKSEWSGKADTSDIPTALSQLDNDANFVQDADYVHTDNNFTDEDKAAIGGIPENITDLSDVEVSNIQNGQVLKWDSTQNKFVNANESGGSGDVADVKVNGTSVVDPVTKEANIDLTGYAETSDIPTDLADLSDDSTHRLVTDTEKSTWDNKADVSDIPTVNNNTITIQKNGQNIDSFTLNQDSNKAINIAVPTKTSDLQNDDSFITNTVNNLANYYLKSDTYTQTEVNNLISAAVNGRFEKVTTLPASGEPNVIYLVPKTTALTNNVYDEYIWQDNAWELLGSTEIDLSNYVTTTDLATALADYVTTSAFNTAIANYYTKTEVGNLLDEKVDKVSGKGLSTYDYDATAKGIVDSVTTNLAGKVDKVNGKGLSTEDYTTTEKNKLAGISTGANKVESSATNGNIKIDGTETQVYDGSGKVDKVNGKGLSTNDYDNTDKAKVDMIDNTTTSASGNPISIADLKSAQIALNPIITFEPIQAGSGTPSPSNIRAIYGYDKIEVLSCKKNIWDGKYSEENKFLSSSGSEVTSSGWYISSWIPVEGEKSYTISVNGNLSGSYWCWYDANKNFIGSKLWSTSGSSSQTMPANAKFIRTSYYTTATNLQIEEGSSATTYEPYHKTTDLSESLGQTVYFASDDVRAGDLSNLGDYADLGNLSWTYRGEIGAGIFATSSITNYSKVNVDILDAICEMYNNGGSVGGVADMNNKSTGTLCLYNGPDSTHVIYIKDTNYSDATAFTSAVSGKKIVYKKETTSHIQHTPHEIALSQGYNYISTNGTSISLAYHNGELASLSDVSQLGETVNELGQYVTSTSLLNGLIQSKEITVTTNASGLANINMDSRKVCIINMFIKSNTTVHYIALVDIYQINSYIVKALNGADLTPVANQSITIVVYYYDLA